MPPRLTRDSFQARLRWHTPVRKTIYFRGFHYTRLGSWPMHVDFPGLLCGHSDMREFSSRCLYDIPHFKMGEVCPRARNPPLWSQESHRRVRIRNGRSAEADSAPGDVSPEIVRWNVQELQIRTVPIDRRADPVVNVNRHGISHGALGQGQDTPCHQIKPIHPHEAPRRPEARPPGDGRSEDGRVDSGRSPLPVATLRHPHLRMPGRRR